MSKDWQSASAAYRSCRHEFLLIARVPGTTRESSRTENSANSAALANRWSSQMITGLTCGRRCQQHSIDIVPCKFNRSEAIIDHALRRFQSPERQIQILYRSAVFAGFPKNLTFRTPPISCGRAPPEEAGARYSGVPLSPIVTAPCKG